MNPELGIALQTDNKVDMWNISNRFMKITL